VAGFEVGELALHGLDEEAGDEPALPGLACQVDDIFAY